MGGGLSLGILFVVDVSADDLGRVDVLVFLSFAGRADAWAICEPLC